MAVLNEGWVLMCWPSHRQKTPCPMVIEVGESIDKLLKAVQVAELGCTAIIKYAKYKKDGSVEYFDDPPKT